MPGLAEVLADLHPFHATARSELVDHIASRSFLGAKVEPVSERPESSSPFLAAVTTVPDLPDEAPVQHLMLHGPAGSGKRSLAEALRHALQGRLEVTVMETDVECRAERGVVVWIVRDGKLPRNMPGRTPRIRVRSLSSSEKRRLLKIQIEDTARAYGLDSKEFLRQEIVEVLVRGGASESGVLGAIQRLHRLCRRRARERSEGFAAPLDGAWAAAVLGPDAYPQEPLPAALPPLALHTPVVSSLGGAIAQIEAIGHVGKGRLILTGAGPQAEDAAKVARSRCVGLASHLRIQPDELRDLDWHVHISGPEGPKDGVSLGWAVLVAMVSHLSGVAVDSRFAFTGEITLSGELRGVGYVDEKFLSCEREGFKRLFLPQRNLTDLSTLDPEAIGSCEPTPVVQDLPVLRGLGLLSART